MPGLQLHARLAVHSSAAKGLHQAPGTAPCRTQHVVLLVLAGPLQAPGSFQGCRRAAAAAPDPDQACRQGLWCTKVRLLLPFEGAAFPSQDQKFKEGGTLIDNSKLRRVSVDVAPPERPCLL